MAVSRAEGTVWPGPLGPEQRQGAWTVPTQEVAEGTVRSGLEGGTVATGDLSSWTRGRHRLCWGRQQRAGSRGRVGSECLQLDGWTERSEHMCHQDRTFGSTQGLRNKQETGPQQSPQRPGGQVEAEREGAARARRQGRSEGKGSSPGGLSAAPVTAPQGRQLGGYSQRPGPLSAPPRAAGF